MITDRSSIDYFLNGQKNPLESKQIPAYQPQAGTALTTSVNSFSSASSSNVNPGSNPIGSFLGNLWQRITGTGKINSPLASQPEVMKAYQSVLDNTPFSDINANLPGIYYSNLAWGDYDNDGKLDILFTGRDSSDNRISKVYRNTGSGFSDIGANLTGVDYGSVAWGDYDHDGKLDILLTGDISPDHPITKVYRNTGSGFSDIGANLSGVWVSSAAWGDYDNDGKLDILLTGADSSGNFISKVYRNTGSGFSDIGANLPGVVYGSVAWGDYDKDGRLDILLTGVDSSANYITKIYRNTGSGFSDIGANLPGVFHSSVAWGDYDNDGKLDILLTGEDSSGKYISKVYRNTGSSFSDIGANLTGIALGSVAWGDYNNDGKLDILLTGDDNSANRIAKVYGNTGNGFSDIGANLPGIDNSSVAWGDYNNDGKLDILLAGDDGSVNYVTKVYGNLSTTVNTPPTAPSSLGAKVTGDTVTFNWNPASDNQTPTAGLTYNLSVGTTPGGSDVVAPMSLASGNRQIAQLGNTGSNTSWTLTNLTRGQTYYWSVQAVDNGFAGSSFTSGSSFTVPLLLFSDINAPITGVTRGSVAWGDYDNDGKLDVLVTGLDSSNNRIAKVYRNTGSGFSDIGANLDGVYNSSVAWGDYDKDGKLDILLTGLDNSDKFVSKIYRNTGSGFSDINANLTGVDNGSVAWGDYNNDGKLDILLTGFDRLGNRIAKVYTNVGSGFADFNNANLTGVAYGSVAWGDYNNDGKLDILLTGLDNQGDRIAKVYRNTGFGFFDIGAKLDGVYQGSVAWGDYNNDGYLDILLAGEDKLGNPITKIYSNTGGNGFSDIGANITNVTQPSIAWGDYDNDGRLDILVTGSDNSDNLIAKIFRNPITKVYRNTGSGFSDINANLSVAGGSVAWGDYDNDGRLDILLTGQGSSFNPITKVYRNLATTANTAPTAPTGLSSHFTDYSVTLSWNLASDAQTPVTGLTYNLRVGTAPGGSDIIAPMSLSSGNRLLAQLGNTDSNSSWTLALTNLTRGNTYYWSVQAIDTALVGSTFATEGSFTVPPLFSDFNGDGKTDLILRNYATGENVFWFMNGATLLSSQDLLPAVNDPNWHLEGTGDFQGNGKTDLVWRNYQTGQNVIWFMDGTKLTYSQFILPVLDTNWQIEGTGDFNNDGKTDLVWRNHKTGQDVIWYMDGTNLKSYQSIQSVNDSNWQIVGTGDFNGDGKIDLVWRNQATGEDVIWFMNGGNLSSWQDIQSVSDTNWQIKGTDDFNNDRFTDLVWRNSKTGENVVWFMNGTKLTSAQDMLSVGDLNWDIVG